MVSRILAISSLVAAVYASPCKPSPPSNTTSASATSSSSFATILPSILPPAPVFSLPTLNGTNLPGPDSGVQLVKIGLGHGLQNYTCANSSATAVNTGALAVLYDVTDLFPGVPDTGLDLATWNSLPSLALNGLDLPLNLQNPGAAAPRTPENFTETQFGAVVADPFPAASADVQLLNLTLPFLARHFFDSKSAPTFDLSAVGLLASVAKTGDVKAPAGADKGLLGTGAVDWLQLKDNGKNISIGLSEVYRVITAGGSSVSCSALGAPAGSVPYAAFYWFFG